jgi:hypothetical protein
MASTVVYAADTIDTIDTPDTILAVDIWFAKCDNGNNSITQ